MKRYLLFLGMGTILALGYIHQRVCLIRLGYQVESLGCQRDDLLDQHRMLHYNVLTLRSPFILEERLAQRNIQLTPPRAVEVLSPTLRMAPATTGWVQTAPTRSGWLQRVLRLATAWFGGEQQAVAEPAREGK